MAAGAGWWAFLSGQYFAAEVTAPAGDGWGRRNFGSRRLFRHTRTTRRRRCRFIPFTFPMDVAPLVACPSSAHQIPTDERKPAWRRACLAYREIRQAGGSDQEAHEAAVAAVLSVWPTLIQKEASAEAVNAIAYATKYHSDWFWRGALQIRKWRGTAH